MKLHIGSQIKRVLEEKGITPDWLAQKISTSRRNLYDILKRDEISTKQLLQISKALKYDFFMLYSEADPELISSEPIMQLEAKRKIMVSVELDGNPLTAEFWIEKIKKLNAAMA
jgi:predicted transcriptional regulator